MTNAGPARTLAALPESEGDGLDNYRRQRAALVAEIATLNQEFFALMGGHQTERTELEKNVGYLKEQSRLLGQERERIQRELNEERTSLDEIRARRTTHEQALGSQKLELEKVAHEVLLGQSQLTEVEAQTLEARELWNKVIRRVEKESAKLDTLKAEVAATEVVRKDAELLSMRLRELEKACGIQRNKLDEWTKSETEHRGRALSAESELGVVQRQVKQAETERESMEAKLLEVARTLQLRQEQLSQAEAEINRRKEALQAFLAQHKKAIDDATGAERLRTAAMNDIKRCEHELRQLQEAGTHAKAQVLKETEQIKILAEKVVEKKKEIEALEVRTAGNDERIHFQQEQMLALQRQQGDLLKKGEEMDVNHAQMHGKLVELESQLQERKRAIETCEALKVKAQEQVDFTKKQGLEVTRALDAQRRQKIELESRCQELVKEGLRLKEQIAAFRGEEESLRESVAPLRLELTQMGEKLTEVGAVYAREEKRAVQLQTKIRELEAGLLLIEKQLAEKSAEQKNAESRLNVCERAELAAAKKLQQFEELVNEKQLQSQSLAELLQREVRALAEAEARKEAAIDRMRIAEESALQSDTNLRQLKGAEEKMTGLIQNAEKNIHELQKMRSEAQQALSRQEKEASILRGELEALKNGLSETRHQCEKQSGLLNGIQNEFESLEIIRTDKLNDISALKEKLRQAQNEMSAAQHQRVGLRNLEQVGEAERALDRLRRRLDL